MMQAAERGRAKIVYWHRELPPVDAEVVGQHVLEAASTRVPREPGHRNELWGRGYAELMTRAEERLQQEIARLGGDCVHVHDESIDPRHDPATGLVWLQGRFFYTLYRVPSKQEIGDRRPETGDQKSLQPPTAERTKMRSSLLLAVLAGVAWGVGGYFEKAGLRSLGMPPIAGITVRTAVALLLLAVVSVPAWKEVAHPSDRAGWLMLAIGGGVVAGALGMWCFYGALATTANLGVTLAIAFACSPVAGTLVAVARRDQSLDLRTALGIGAIVAGIVMVQMGRSR